MKKEKKKKNNDNIFFVAVGIFIGLILCFLFYSIIVQERIAEIPKIEVDALTVYHWWTSKGEAAAINELNKQFTNEYPDTALISTPIIGGAGGGGLDLARIIKSMAGAYETPDSFQTHPGYGVMFYYEQDILEIVDHIWFSENLEEVIPNEIKEISKINDHYYSVPLNVHKVNLVWYNKAILDEHDINSSTLNDWDSFFEACEKLRKKGIKYPIQMGETWTGIEVFVGIILGRGEEFFEDFVNGKISSKDDPDLVESIEIFERYLSYVNPDSPNISWDIAVDRIINGEGVFNLIGDFAYGEFEVAGMQYNIDYGSFPVPKTEGIYVYGIDSFVKPKYTAHSNNSDKWLKTVASREGQNAFNPKKGSIPVRTDSDLSLYTDYQKTSFSSFSEEKLLPSWGLSFPFFFREYITEIIAEFIRDKDKEKMAISSVNLMKKLEEEYVINWSFSSENKIN